MKHCIGICEITEVETLNISVRSDFLVTIPVLIFVRTQICKESGLEDFRLDEK